MTEPFSKKQASKLAKTLLSLVQTYQLGSPHDDAKTKAILFTKCIIEVARRTIASEKIAYDLNATDPYKELTALKGSIDDALKKAENLSSMSHLELLLLDLNDKQEILPSDERLVVRLTEAVDIVEAARMEVSPRKKGRPKQIGKEDFIEVIIQLFERVVGMNFEELEQLSIQERRKMKTTFYGLLEAAQFSESFIQSDKAMQKYADRYLKEERIKREEVQEILKEFL